MIVGWLDMKRQTFRKMDCVSCLEGGCLEGGYLLTKFLTQMAIICQITKYPHKEQPWKTPPNWATPEIIGIVRCCIVCLQRMKDTDMATADNLSCRYLPALYSSLFSDRQICAQSEMSKLSLDPHMSHYTHHTGQHYRWVPLNPNKQNQVKIWN